MIDPHISDARRAARAITAHLTSTQRATSPYRGAIARRLDRIQIADEVIWVIQLAPAADWQAEPGALLPLAYTVDAQGQAHPRILTQYYPADLFVQEGGAA
jgi:hypothetical protein